VAGYDERRHSKWHARRGCGGGARPLEPGLRGGPTMAAGADNASEDPRPTCGRRAFGHPQRWRRRGPLALIAVACIFMNRWYCHFWMVRSSWPVALSSWRSWPSSSRCGARSGRRSGCRWTTGMTTAPSRSSFCLRRYLPGLVAQPGGTRHSRHSDAPRGQVRSDRGSGRTGSDRRASPPPPSGVGIRSELWRLRRRVVAVVRACPTGFSKRRQSFAVAPCPGSTRPSSCQPILARSPHLPEVIVAAAWPTRVAQFMAAR
jgi:hypothetical protein